MGNRFSAACKAKNNTRALEILESMDKYDVLSKNGNTLLMIACKNNMTVVALKIIEYYTNSNIIDVRDFCNILNHNNKRGYTALYYAIQNKMYDVIKKLMEYNVKTSYHIFYPETNETFDKSVLVDICCWRYEFKNKEQLSNTNFILKLMDLTESKDFLTKAFHCYLRNNVELNMKVINKFIDKKLDLNHEISGSTALTILCEYRGGYMPVLELLIKNNVNVNVGSNSYNNTPLYYLCNAGYVEAAKYLIKHGAKIDEGHTTPVRAMINNKMYDMLRDLKATYPNFDMIMTIELGKDYSQKTNNYCD